MSLGLGALVSHGFGLSLVPAMLPRIEAEFDSGYGVLGLSVATGLIAYAIGSLLASPVMRRVPTRALLNSTYAVTGSGLMLIALADSPSVLAGAVVLLGLSAPISWTASNHVARETVEPGRLASVLAAASGGSALGVVVNAVLVRTSGSVHHWRLSFWLASGVAALSIVVTTRAFTSAMRLPGSSGRRLRRIFGDVLTDQTGRLIVVTSGVSGVVVFTLATFLTATALDEMGTTDTLAALLVLIGGSVGLVASIAMGRLGDRRTPTASIAISLTVYAGALSVLVVAWTYAGLLVAVIGYGILNGPVWGLMGAQANRMFTAEIAVGAVSLGLVASSVVGAMGNVAAGAVIDSTGTFRAPVALLAVLAGANAVYLALPVGVGSEVRLRILE